jgi:hypothetical protein
MRDPEQPHLLGRRGGIGGDLSQRSLNALFSALFGIGIDGGGGREMMEGGSSVVDGDAVRCQGRGQNGFEEGSGYGAFLVSGFVSA